MALQLYKIAAVEVGSAGSATMDFTSIPQGYTDLVLKYSARGTGLSDTWDLGKLRFNGSSTGYSSKLLQGNGSAASSASDSSTDIVFLYIDNILATTSTFSSNEIYIPNYAGSSYKSISSDFVTETNATASLAGLVAGLWSNTAAINQITLYPKATFNFAQYTTATLYGIL
jgi:hypothetical protein